MSKDDLAEDIIENILGDDDDDHKEHYRHGGSQTPQYYCTYCKRAHTKHSMVGKEHIMFRRK